MKKARVHAITTWALTGLLWLSAPGVIGQSFVTPPAPVNGDASGATAPRTQPRAVLGALGAVFVAWTRGGNGYSKVGVRVAYSPDWGESWVGENLVSSTSQFNDNPGIAADPSGKVIAVWESRLALFPFSAIAWAMSVDNGQNWTPRYGLTNTPFSIYNIQPSIATDGLGTWIVVYLSNDDLGGTIGTDYDVLFARSTDNGDNWTVAALNTDAASDAWEDQGNSSDALPVVRTDGQGHWCVLWTRRDTATNDEGMMLARSADNGLTWSVPIVGHIAPASSAYALAGYDITPGGSPGSWVIAISYVGIHIARSDDHGASWSHVISTVGPTGSPAIVSDRSANCLVTWSEATGAGSVIMAARSGDDGMSWSAPAPASASPEMLIGDNAAPSAATDQNGNWLVAWSSTNDLGGTIGTDEDILFSRGVGPSPTADLSITTSNPTLFDYQVDVMASGFTPGNQYFTCFSFEPGEHPAGAWFGIDPLFSELALQAAVSAPPFNGTFDGAGTAAYSWTLLGTPGPLGLSLYAVTLEHQAGKVLRASPPAMVTL